MAKTKNMLMKISPVKIKDDPQNKVTSFEVFQKHRIKKGERYTFDEEGIFSEMIFGKFGKCNCGKLTKPGICTACRTRVLDKRNVPNFYMEFDIDLPNRAINFGNKGKEHIEDILNYRGFWYEGEYKEYNLDTLNTSKFDKSKVLIGKDALLQMGISEEWYNANVHRKISIPHTAYRQITIQNGKRLPGELNKIYLRMLKLNARYKALKSSCLLNIFDELNIRYLVCEQLDKMYKERFNILANNKQSLLALELRGQPETGMVRAVMTNNFSLEEDDIMIGSYFLSTLYPRFYKMYSKEDGTIDIDAVNEELVKGDYLVLINRQPTIGAKSIVAMKPKFSKKDSERFVLQVNPIVYDGLAADVDGDTINVIALYTVAACTEARKLLASNNYIEGSNGGIRNGILEEFAYVKKVIETEESNNI